jgi:hypothetical protein
LGGVDTADIRLNPIGWWEPADILLNPIGCNTADVLLNHIGWWGYCRYSFESYWLVWSLQKFFSILLAAILQTFF